MPPKSKELLTLGDKLRKRREELKLSQEFVAHEVQAPLKYIRALEEDDYEIFSAKIYALGYFKKVLHILTVENQSNFLKEFANEWDVRMFRKEREITPLPENRGPEPQVTPARLLAIMGVAIVGLLIIFFGSQLLRFVVSPRLNIVLPPRESVAYDYLTQVKGTVAKESSLTVNGREIMLDAAGKFDEKIELPAGLNELEFIVEDRFGKTSRDTRYVLIK